jgi:UDP:flavonoid glycosyltransferase YjiC (YdhE family)
VVLPVFWEQYATAPRVDELGFGQRLATYTCSAEELNGAIDGLLADAALHERLVGVSARVQQEPGTVEAADLIERVARDRGPVTG